MRLLYSVITATALSSPAFSQVIYDINFQSADQPVNRIVTTGLAPEHVSDVLFGRPTVVAAFGSLADQPLLFDSNGETPFNSFYYT